MLSWPPRWNVTRGNSLSTPIVVPSSKRVCFCCDLGNFNKTFYGNWLAFGAVELWGTAAFNTFISIPAKTSVNSSHCEVPIVFPSYCPSNHISQESLLHPQKWSDCSKSYKQMYKITLWSWTKVIWRGVFHFHRITFMQLFGLRSWFADHEGMVGWGHSITIILASCRCVYIFSCF